MTRKPYTRPQLVKYGHIKALVQGTGGKRKDFIGRNSKTCWIAEALYGADDARTMLLRAWLTSIYESRRRGWMLVWGYRTVGRSTATLISRGVLPRGPFLRLFDGLLERAVAESAPAVVASRRR